MLVWKTIDTLFKHKLVPGLVSRSYSCCQNQAEAFCVLLLCEVFSLFECISTAGVYVVQVVPSIMKWHCIVYGAYCITNEVLPRCRFCDHIQTLFYLLSQDESARTLGVLAVHGRK